MRAKFLSSVESDTTLLQAYNITLAPGGKYCHCMGSRGKQLCFVSFNTCFHNGDDIEFDKSQVTFNAVQCAPSKP